MNTQNQNIDYLIGQLLTEDAKVLMTIAAVDKGLTKDPHYVRKVVDYRLLVGDYLGAMKTALILGDKEKIKEIIRENNPERQKEFEESQARGIAHNSVLNAIGKEFDTNKIYKQAKNLMREAEEAEAHGDKGRAGYLYSDVVMKLKMIGRYDEILEFCNRRGFVKMATEIYDEGIRIFEQLGRFKDASRLEQIRGNQPRAQMYQSLAELVR